MKLASFGQDAARVQRFSLVLKVVTLSAQSVEIVLVRPLLRDQLVNSRRALFLLETACLEGGREGRDKGLSYYRTLLIMDLHEGLPGASSPPTLAG